MLARMTIRVALVDDQVGVGGAEAGARDADGRTPVELARRSGHESCVRKLLHAGASTELRALDDAVTDQRGGAATPDPGDPAFKLRDRIIGMGKITNARVSIQSAALTAIALEISPWSPRLFSVQAQEGPSTISVMSVDVSSRVSATSA